jgi:large subunit ribosomal protein L32e
MKPKFIRQDSNKFRCLGKKWRKPKGLHSKLRNRFGGHRSNVSVGWKSHNAIRGLVLNLQNVLVYSLKQLENINPEIQGITIARSVGLKKRVPIVNKAKERNIKILNIKNIDNYIARHVAMREERKKQREKPKVEKLKKEEKKTEEQKKEQPENLEASKEELDKLLIKRV